MLIPLTKWAEKRGVSLGTAQKWANKGKLQTAQKPGRDWFVEESEPIPPDRRYVDNPVRNRRKGEPHAQK